MTLKDLISDDSSELFVMSVDSIGSRYKGGIKQVYDATLKGWMSIENHRANITNYFEQVSDKNTAEHYIKHYYSNLLKDFYQDDKERLNKYVCFFITPHTNWDSEDFCHKCYGEGSMECEACKDALEQGYSQEWCDECDDTSLVDCEDCLNLGIHSKEYLIGAVSWYSFQTPYTDDENNAIYIDSIIHFGMYEFQNIAESLAAGSHSYALNQNEVSEDVISALIWSKISEIEEVNIITHDSSISSSYYGFIPDYDSLIERIGNTIGLKISNAIGGNHR